MDIVELAKSKIGQDASPRDLAPDSLGCAETVSTILHEYDPTFPIVIGTEQLYLELVKSRKWRKILTPEAGCVVISPTGYRLEPSDMKHGHTGIYITDNLICSNDSATGKWLQNYNRITWRQRYYYEGRYPVFCFKKVA